MADPEKSNSQEQTQGVYPVKFCPQKGAQYHPLIRAGFAKDLETSGFCWLAQLDMAISTREPIDERRFKIVFGIAESFKDLGMLTKDGGIETKDREPEYLDVINNHMSEGEIPLEIALLDITGSQDFIRELESGNILCLTIDYRTDHGHGILMDELFMNRNRTEGVMGFWNPMAPDANALFAREFVGTGSRYFTVQGEPAIIAPNAKVIRLKPGGML